MAIKTTKVLSVPMTTPAIVTLVCYAIIIFIVLLPIDMFVYSRASGEYVKSEYDFGYRVLLSLLLLFPFLLSVYSVNCMMVGNCTLWSWIVTFLTVIWAVLITVTTFASGSFSLNTVI